MKATKKIVGAACALVAAVALSAGSTFAWFTSNGTVTATGLEIDVNTSNSYLIIADSTGKLSEGAKTLSLAQIGKVADTSDDAEEGATVPVKLLPSAYQTITAVDAENKTVTLEDQTKEGKGENATENSIVTESTWYTAQGTDSDNGTVEVWKVGDIYEGTELKDGDAQVGKPKTTALTAANFSSYVVVADMVVSISVGSTPVEDVKVTMNATLTSETKDCPIRVVFLYQTVAPKTEGGSPAWGDLGDWTKVDVLAKDGLGASTGLSLGGIDSSDHYIAVKVMVFMDGNDTSVKTTNSANLQGVTLDFSFSDPKQATPVVPEP